jgi:hypothetical protein
MPVMPSLDGMVTLERVNYSSLPTALSLIWVSISELRWNRQNTMWVDSDKSKIIKRTTFRSFRQAASMSYQTVATIGVKGILIN